MRIRLYNPDGSLAAENPPVKEYLRWIPAGSIDAVRNDASFISDTIIFFKPGYASHDEIYIGSGKNRVASAEPTGFRLRDFKRHLEHKKPGMHVRTYTNSKLTIQELEIIKERAYDIMAEEKMIGYDYGAIAKKAWYATCSWVKGLFGIKSPNKIDPDHDMTTGVCNERIIECYMPCEQEYPYIRVIPKDVTKEESGPGDIDAYMTSKEAKRAGWYISSEMDS